MPETISAGEFQIVSVFDDKYRFEIPAYQRPYSWTTEQAGELLDDLLYATRDVENTESVNEHSPYFLGSIVIIKEGDAEPRAEVVDGQQRITTLTILFCALRELATKESAPYFDVYVRETSNPLAGISGRFRLAVRERDRDFFQDNIQRMGKLPELVSQSVPNLPDSQLRMFENAKRLWERVSDLSEDKRAILATFIIQRCFLVVVATTDQASAYRIFAVMNDRGLDLSPTDILKAQIIGGMNSDIRSRYTNIWESLEEEVGRDGFREIFAHIRMIRLKSKLRGTLQQEFQDHVLKGVDGARFIDETLVPYANAWDAVTNASYESASGSESVNGSLRHLNRLDNFDWIPPAMAFLKSRDRDSRETVGFFRDLERLAYGLFLRRADVNSRILRYARVIGCVESGEDLFADSSPLQLHASEKTAILAALNGQIYDRSRVSRVGRALLLRLDSLLTDAGVTYDHPIISIEHVLPQNPARDSEWAANFSQEERDEWTGRLANLVLLSRRKNSGARNHDFDRKKNVYFKRGGASMFALTLGVLDESEWTPAVLERRQRRLIDALKTEWRLG